MKTPSHPLELPDRDRPYGTVKHRIRKALHWHWVYGLEQQEIAPKLGVQPKTVQDYLKAEPAQEVKEMLNRESRQVRVTAIEELKQQLREAKVDGRSAEKPVEIWEEDGHILVSEFRGEGGEIIDKKPIPSGFELDDDLSKKAMARDEVRDILDMMATLVGANEPEQVEVEHSGGLNVTVNETIIETDD